MLFPGQKKNKKNPTCRIKETKIRFPEKRVVFFLDINPSRNKTDCFASVLLAYGLYELAMSLFYSVVNRIGDVFPKEIGNLQFFGVCATDEGWVPAAVRYKIIESIKKILAQSDERLALVLTKQEADRNRQLVEEISAACGKKLIIRQLSL